VTRERAFGLDLDARFGLDGFAGAVPPAGDRLVRLRLVPEAELRELAGAGESERIAAAAGADGAEAASIDRVAAAGGEGAPALGYLASATGFGRAWIDAGGGDVRVAAAALPAWRWQRFLVGQVLPFAAVLNGLEVFHASAVAVEGRAVAVVAASGAGKTSLALELVLLGLDLVDDDVLAVERAGHGLIAHPGAPLANVRHDGTGLAERLCEAGHARVLGSADGETRVELRPRAQALPLSAIFFLRRTGEGEASATGEGDRARIERIDPVDPRLLLAATFNLALRDPGRLTRQLDVCSAGAGSAALFAVDCPPSVDAPQLARQIRDVALGAAGPPS
jgi:hypothetical protein